MMQSPLKSFQLFDAFSINSLKYGALRSYTDFGECPGGVEFEES